MEINEIIKKRRTELGLTLDDVAEALGVAKSTVSRYETKDIQHMGIDKIAALAKVLQCSPGYLMGWEEYPNKKASLLDEPGIVLAAHRANGYDEPLPPEAMAELESILGYLREKYKKK